MKIKGERDANSVILTHFHHEVKIFYGFPTSIFPGENPPRFSPERENHLSIVVCFPLGNILETFHPYCTNEIHENGLSYSPSVKVARNYVIIFTLG